MPELEAKDLLAYYGAFLSTLLAVVKFLELWHARMKVEVSYSFTTSVEVGNKILVRNLSSKPLLLRYWSVEYCKGFWPFWSFQNITGPDYDYDGTRIEPHSTLTLTFANAEYFSTSPKALDGRRIFIFLDIAGMRKRYFKVYSADD